jgi:mannitol-specific phosphotransferase system IIBC component
LICFKKKEQKPEAELYIKTSTEKQSNVPVVLHVTTDANSIDLSNSVMKASETSIATKEASATKTDVPLHTVEIPLTTTEISPITSPITKAEKGKKNDSTKKRKKIESTKKKKKSESIKKKDNKKTPAITPKKPTFLDKIASSTQKEPEKKEKKKKQISIGAFFTKINTSTGSN